MSYLKGYLTLVKTGDAANSVTKIPAQTDSSIELTTETEDVTTKDSDVDQTTGWLFPEEEVSMVRASIQATCLKDDTTANGVHVGTEVFWAFASGGDTYSGKGLVTRLRESGQVNGRTQVEVTISSKGAIEGI